jgi:hypothetical protein
MTNWAENKESLHHHTMEMEQMIAHLLAEMKAKVKANHEVMLSKMKNNQEETKVSQE